MSSIACPVCGRRITTSGASHPPTSCPACGASLLAADQTPGGDGDSHDDSATRPIALDRFPTRPVPPAPAPDPAPAGGETANLRPSALPQPPAPGAPLGGASDVDRAALLKPADGETRDLPASALPQLAPDAKRDTGRDTGRGLGRGLGMVALVALLLAVVAVAALVVNGALPFAQQAATPTATATPASPTATPATITYTRAGLYSIAYPTGWSKTEQNHPPTTYSVTFINPSGGASLTVTTQQTPELIDAATMDTNYLNSLASTTGTKPANLSKPQPVTLAGQIWTVESADVAIQTTAGKQYAHAVAMTVNYHGYLYTTVRLVPVTDPAGAVSAFTVAEQACFQPMLVTFTFLG